MKISVKVLIFLFVMSAGVYSQDFLVAISYLHGEKSKDSHSTEESFAITGDLAAYSVEYKGRIKKEDNSKTCNFTEQDIKNIKQTIETKNLNVVDSLYQESSKTQSYERYINLEMVIKMDGGDYRIKINGDIKEFEDKMLYKNSIFFITMLRKMVEGCK
jgi:hypothetical protein